MTTESLLEIYARLSTALRVASAGFRVSFPASAATPMSALVDMAGALQCRLLPPEVTGEDGLIVTLETLDARNTFHGQSDNGSEKYGVHSAYGDICRLADPGFFTGLWEALSLAGLREGNRVLDLGVNTGDELAIIEKFCGSMASTMGFTGIDQSESAIEVARNRFAADRFQFFVQDINQLEKLDLGRFDLLLSIATLHSPGVDTKRVFMWAMQHLLQNGAAVIIGFPNCRFMGGEPVYGARTKNRREQDMSLVIKDVHFVKKYLQQHGFRVVVNGKNYLFVTGVSRNRRSSFSEEQQIQNRTL